MPVEGRPGESEFVYEFVLIRSTVSDLRQDSSSEGLHRSLEDDQDVAHVYGFSLLDGHV